MDINHSLHAEQVALMRADRTTDVQVRFTQDEIAKEFGARLKASSYPHRTPLRHG